MESLTPPVLNLARELHWRIRTGHSMRESVRSALAQDSSAYARRLREWWELQAQNSKHIDPKSYFSSPYQIALADLISRGCAGQPTSETLSSLCDEIENAANDEIETHINSLPFKLLIPLLLFQFPAFLILLIGPLLRELQHQMGG